MRVTVDVFREADGRLEGFVDAPGGAGGRFVSTLDLLRVLEGLRLTPSPSSDSSAPEARRRTPDPQAQQARKDEDD